MRPAPPLSICCDRGGKRSHEGADDDVIQQGTFVGCVLSGRGGSPECEQEIDTTHARTVVQRSEADSG